MASKSGILALALELAERRVSARQLTDRVIDMSSRVNGGLGCVTLSVNEAALKQAESIDRKREQSSLNGSELTVLAGIPFAVKDIFALKGCRTTAGSHILDNFISPYDSAVAESIQKADGIICLKSNLDEFGMGSSMLNSGYGPCANPWGLPEGPLLTPGGSSGASAATVASGLTPAAIGSDTGGSVRQPASFCGVVGLKPTYGTVSRHGLISYASSMDTPGVLARSVTDAAIVFDTVAGSDVRDSTRDRSHQQRHSVTSELFPGVDLSKQGAKQVIDLISRSSTAEIDLRGMVVGVPDEFIVAELDGQARKEYENALNILQDAGAEVKRISIPSLKLALPCYYLLACAEASSNLSKYDGVRYGQRSAVASDDQQGGMASVSDLHKMMSVTRGEFFGNEVIKRILTGSFVLSKDAFHDYYGKASAVRNQLSTEFQTVFSAGVHLIAGLTTPVLPFPLQQPPCTLDMLVNDYLTVSSNLVGVPAVNVPVAVTARTNAAGATEVLPVGLQLFGSKHSEATLLRAALALEQRVGFSDKIPEHVYRFLAK